jgi:asparagine synthase (glutamine-hydrolysing)
MIADVPLGVFLSGGVDSSIIVSVMADLAHLPIKTFSIANEVKAYDESEKAREVASIFKTEHIECRISNEQICDIAEKTICNFDEPFGDSSALPSYVVSTLAEKHVKVILTGDGGDELFAGYTRYRIFRYLDFYSKLPGWLRNGIIAPAVQGIPDFTGPASVLAKMRKLVGVNTSSAFDAYHSLQCLGFPQEKLHEILPRNMQLQSTRDRAFDVFKTLSERTNLDRALYADITMGLEGDMLTKVDRSSMLASVETRCPYLDHRMVEFSFSIPPQFKMRGSKLKAVLKDTFEDRFPRNFFDKPKMGFGIPVGQFLRTVFSSRLTGIIESGPLHDTGIIDINHARKLVEEHHRGIDHTFKLWTIFSFGLWLEKNQSRIRLD